MIGTVKCPKCASLDRVEVAATVWVCMHPDGTETEKPDGYDGDSQARCPSCGHQGQFREWQGPEWIMAPVEAQ